MLSKNYWKLASRFFFLGMANLFLLKINMGKQYQQTLKCKRKQKWSTLQACRQWNSAYLYKPLVLLSSFIHSWDCVTSTIGCVLLLTFYTLRFCISLTWNSVFPLFLLFYPIKCYAPHYWSTGLPRRTQLPIEADVLNGNARMICQNTFGTWHLILPAALSREEHCQQAVKNDF